jgi:hypothetical protein
MKLHSRFSANQRRSLVLFDHIVAPKACKRTGFSGLRSESGTMVKPSLNWDFIALIIIIKLALVPNPDMCRPYLSI